VERGEEPRPTLDEPARDPAREALLPSDQRAALLNDVAALLFQLGAASARRPRSLRPLRTFTGEGGLQASLYSCDAKTRGEPKVNLVVSIVKGPICPPRIRWLRSLNLFRTC
jgi:hypothetical protein